MRGLLVLPLLLSFSVAIAQTGSISGTVVDAVTQETLPFANVYVNRTTLGTTAAGDGKFSINRVPVGTAEVVCSFIGYETANHAVQIVEGETSHMTIALQPVTTTLDEVTVSAKRDKQWERNLVQFRKVFLGKDDIASQCVITNPEVIDFTRSSEGLLASASQPLEIINGQLGYRLKYELIHFAALGQQYTIGGNLQFEALESSDTVLIRRWAINRDRVYRNSLRYLLKSMIDNRLDENGFSLFIEKNPDEKFVRSDVFAHVKPYVTPFDPSVHLIPPGATPHYVFPASPRIEVHDRRSNRGRTYRDVSAQITWIETLGPLIISSKGIVQNPNALVVLGHMSETRVAHLLPEDYVPGPSPQAVRLAVTPPDQLTEQIYLHTDKDHYYPGDMIWFKGYMKYGIPELADSLSRVAYVELIDSTHRVVDRQTLFVQLGGFEGNIRIRPGMPSGKIYLRAYTQWMRNFGEEHFFCKAIPLLDLYQRVESTGIRHQQPGGSRVVIKPQKEAVREKEPVSIALHVVDRFGNEIAGDLSIAVADLAYAQPIDTATMAGCFYRPRPTKFRNDFHVERAIPIRGHFVAGRKHQEPVTVTAVLGEMEDADSFTTGQDGSFYFEGFSFFDSTTVYFQALDRRKRPFGEFNLDPPDVHEVNFLPAAPRLNLKHAPFPAPRIAFADDGKVTVLDEVTVTAKKEKQFRDMYGKGDISLTGDYIRSLNPTDLVSVLQNRMPYVRVRYFTSPEGFLRQQVTISGMYGEPLLVIDGTPLTSDGDIALALRQINVRHVERIEVLRAGSAALYGSRGAGGVIVVYTKGQHSDSGERIFDSTDFTAVPVEGFKRPGAFSFPDYSKGVSEPDHRTTIYWNPSIWVDGNGAQTVSFYAAAEPATYLITVKGMTINGEPVHGTATIIVGAVN